MDKLKMHTPDLAEENYKKLAALFPDAVTETIDDDGNVVRAIDKDVLTQEINAQVIDDGQERYQFTWPDKKKSVVLANQPIAKTLRFEKEKSVGKDGTPGGADSENIYIEGDNLDALKLLQETYLGKVKMIYIDPPYNTGTDFVYADDFSQESEEYKKEGSGQFDDAGNRLVQNPESVGRFHTNWLNMLYPRLRIAKDLLSENGIIFISIDDNEQENLRKICDEVFGRENFVCQFIWKSKPQGGNDNPHIVSEHEYILCFARDAKKLMTNGRPLSDDNKYKNRDEFYSERGGYFLGKLDLSTLGYRENLDYAITAPDGSEVYPGGVTKLEQEARKKNNTNHTNDWQWRWSKERFQSAKKNGFIEFKKHDDGHWTVYAKEYEKVDRDGKPIKREIKYRTVIEDVTTVDGTGEIRELIGNRVFSFPKPTKLLEKFVEIGSNNDSLVLDFFSGSGSFAHAVMNHCAKTGKHISWILVQIREITPKISEAKQAGFDTICDIGEERIRRAGKKIKEETGANIDYGFRCFKVDSSNMKDVYYRPTEIGQMNMDQLTDNIKEDRTPEDLLIQVMLDLGVLLSSKVEQTEVAGKKIFSVEDGYLIACFDRNVTEDVVTAIAKRHPFYAVFRDSSMANDSVAANFEQIFETYSPLTVRKVL